MKGNERKKEKKKGKAEGGSPKKISEYQKSKTSKQDTELNLKPKV
ncbi:hypothetical protein EZS27_015661 [termite gut metagenome]|jgi:hypothetical protein|uniref:Uncharacterized protein n=1 Tax=termite gut metagenome TaxID=433724 RepID=A0A5J4RSP0_9ZZZZ